MQPVLAKGLEQVEQDLDLAVPTARVPMNDLGQQSLGIDTEAEDLLALDGTQRVTADALRSKLALGEMLGVRLRIFDGSRVVAESNWMDASDSLASIADHLR
jgi:hypothetical protein